MPHAMGNDEATDPAHIRLLRPDRHPQATNPLPHLIQQPWLPRARIHPDHKACPLTPPVRGSTHTTAPQPATPTGLGSVITRHDQGKPLFPVGLFLQPPRPLRHYTAGYAGGVLPNRC